MSGADYTARHAADIKVNIGHDGVSIKLPRLTVEVSKRHAERLRDVLNTVLPEQITDLMTEPRIADVDVLQAAQALLAERGQDTESLGVAIEQLERAGALGGVPRVRRQRKPSLHYLLSIASDVEPELGGPYQDDAERLEAAQDYVRTHGDEDDLFRVDVFDNDTCPVTVDVFSSQELEMPEPPVPTRRIRWVSTCWIDRRNATVHRNEKGMVEVNAYNMFAAGRPSHTARFTSDSDAEACARAWTHRGEWKTCCLCKCDATGEAFGLPVCDYHADHSEDEPRCPDCVPVHTGDRVRDPLDGTWRIVARLDLTENTAHMADGGCMSIDEAGAAEKRLPSEDLS